MTKEKQLHALFEQGMSAEAAWEYLKNRDGVSVYWGWTYILRIYREWNKSITCTERDDEPPYEPPQGE